jgi:hypothetical protein
MDDKPNEEIIDIVLRQTTLTRDEVIERLNKNENNYIKVIEEFMGINKNITKDKTNITVNQKIYKEIRTIMDDASNNFRNNITMIKK